MEIKYRNKPTEELMKSYCAKLEDFLSPHQLKIEVELFDRPIEMQSYTNDSLTGKTFLWLSKIKIYSQATGELEIRINRSGIDDEISNQEVWTDAWLIQNEIYKRLG